MSLRQTILDTLPPAVSGEWMLTARLIELAIAAVPGLRPIAVWPVLAELACGRVEVSTFGGQQWCRLRPWTEATAEPANSVGGDDVERENEELLRIMRRAQAKHGIDDRRDELDAEKSG